MNAKYMPTGKLQFPYKGGTYSFHPAEIIRLEAESNYTYIHLKDHKTILMAKVLRFYGDLLEPFGFIRIHKSHLVNPTYITGVSERGEVLMLDKTIAVISRRKRKTILNKFLHKGTAA
jgi:two-component system LytT family response regulator